MLAEKFSKTIPKSTLNILKLKINRLKQDVETILLLSAILLKLYDFEKKLWGKTKTNKLCILFPSTLSRV